MSAAFPVLGEKPAVFKVVPESGGFFRRKGLFFV
jgi:hypothetical protein